MAAARAVLSKQGLGVSAAACKPAGDARSTGLHLKPPQQQPCRLTIGANEHNGNLGLQAGQQARGQARESQSERVPAQPA